MNKKSSHVFLKILFVVFVFVFNAAVSYFASNLAFFRGKNLRVPFDGDTSKSQLVDDAELFDKSEEKELNKLIRECSKELEINIIVFVSGMPMSDRAAEEFAAKTFDAFMGKQYCDGVFYYMDFSSKKPAYDFLWCVGKASVIYGDNPSDITDKIVPYLPPSSKKDVTSADVRPGIERFLEVLRDYNSKYKCHKTYYSTDDKEGVYFFDTGSEFYVTKEKAPGLRFRLFAISLNLGFVAALIIYFVIKHRYKFKDKTNPGIYVAQGRTHFTEQSDTFIRTYTTSHRIQSNSSGGHRSGGGHHSGGHSGGRGGGSHR